MPRRTVTTSIDIDADPMAIWAVLVDLDRYPEWNPHIRRASGEMAVGNRLTLRMQPPRGRPVTIRPKVTVAEPGVELRLLGRVPWVFSGEHSFALTRGASGTHLVQSETYRGPLVVLLAKTIESAQTSFNDHNRALKERVESMSRPAADIVHR